MAANTDLFNKAGLPGSVTTLSAPGKAIGASSINVVSTSNLPTDTGLVFELRQITTSTVNGQTVTTTVPGTYTVWEGVVTGASAIGSLRLLYGTDQVYPAGTNTQAYVSISSLLWNNFISGILVNHNQDGSQKAFTESNIVPANAIQTSAVTTPKINNAAVTPDKLATGASSVYAAANSTTTNTSYAVLADGLDSTVTVTIGANGIALVNLASLFSNNTTNSQSFMGFTVTGASSVAANDNMSVMYQAYTVGGQAIQGATYLVTGLTPGSNVFHIVYRASANQAIFQYRRMSVVPL